MNFLHMSFHTNWTKGKNLMFEKILCHNICTYWFNFEFLIFNASNFLLWTFFICLFTPIQPREKNFIFEQILCHTICTYWFNFEFLILNTSNFLLWTFFIYPFMPIQPRDCILPYGFSPVWPISNLFVLFWNWKNFWSQYCNHMVQIWIPNYEIPSYTHAFGFTRK